MKDGRKKDREDRKKQEEGVATEEKPKKKKEQKSEESDKAANPEAEKKVEKKKASSSSSSSSQKKEEGTAVQEQTKKTAPKTPKDSKPSQNKDEQPKQPREPRAPGLGRGAPRKPMVPGPIRNTGLEPASLDDMLTAITNHYGDRPSIFKQFFSEHKDQLIHIFSFLSLRNILKLSLVDRFFHNFIKREERLWKELCWRDFAVTKKVPNSKGFKQTYKISYKGGNQ